MNGLFCLRCLLFSLFFFSHAKIASLIKVKFTNVQCEVYDKTYSTFKRCELKLLARDKIALYINAHIHKLPIDNVQINAAFFRKVNGYRPFLYNTTTDLCKFFSDQYRYMFWKIFYDMMKSHSNINHSCPYNHHLAIDGLILNGDMFKLIPLPTDNYLFRLKAATNNTYRGEVRYYFQIYE